MSLREEPDSYIAKTGQRWKVYSVIYVFPSLVLGAVIAGQYNLFGATLEENGRYQFLAIVLAFCALVWGLVSVQCRNCGTRLLWYAMLNKNANESLGWLVSTPNCPVCKSDGSGS